MNETRPVLIVGAGPTGLMAAMELARFGVRVRIVDKLAAPSTTSRALAVQARTLELFEQRGLAAEMVRIGNQAAGVSIHGDEKCLATIELSQVQSRYSYILLLSQAETERILREQLARQGVQIERQVELIAFAQTGEGVRGILRQADGGLEEVDAAYLISAEGAHSMVRRTAGQKFEGKSLRQHFALGDLYMDGDLREDQITIFTSKNGFVGLFPMGNRHFRLIASDPETEKTEEPRLEELQRLYDADAHIPAHLRDMTWSSRFKINSRMLQQLQEERVFFGGDSAHIHSPAGGQGMNTGLQDMINLGWKMAWVMQGKASPDLLKTYEEDRIPVIHSVLTITEAMTAAVASDHTLVHEALTHIAPILIGTKFAQERATSRISQIALDYRKSSLSETKEHHGSLQAGDRVPDVEVSVADGDSSPRTVRLYELLDPSRFTLLVTEEGAAEGFPERVSVQLKPWSSLLQIIFIRSLGNAPDTGLFLVRPDAYFGFVGEGSSVPALTEWLRRWFPPQG